MQRTVLYAAAGMAALAASGPALADQPPVHEIGEVVVTAAPYAVSLDSATTSVAVVDRESLDTAPVGGLGDVLTGMPGVRSTFFGPGASRPVIRGLAGPRVLVLSNGLGQVDASALSPDHAVATDPQEAERIEVLRGPSALAYGGSAIGGIVNVIDERVAVHRIDGLEGRVLASASTVDDGRLVSGALRAGLGSFVVSLDALRRDSADYEVPTHPESRRLMEADGEAWPGPVRSTVENTATELSSFGTGLSWIGERGHLGVGVKRTETTYGVPGHEHGAEGEHSDEAGVAIQLEQTRYDLRGEYRLEQGPFERLRFAGGYADYTHVELEDGAVATRFLSQGWEARLEVVQPDRDGWQGAVGVQGLSRDFDAHGEEALVPPTRTREWGVFTLQRLDRDGWGVEGGLRLDSRSLKTVAAARDFTNVSASLAGFIRPGAGWFLSLSASRTGRAPAQEELFANGPHPATRGFEIGDADLDREVSYSLDATIHYGSGPWNTDIHLFAVRYDGFIELAPTGQHDEGSGLPIFRYTQTDATFAGAEAEASLRLWEAGERSFTLEGSADYVRGETGLGPPARIPPWSATVRGVFDGGWWDGRLEVRRVGAQERLAAFELPTDGYTLLNATLTFRPLKDRDFKLFVDGRNLSDAEAREHASFLKDIAPLPGRSIRIGVGYRF